MEPGLPSGGKSILGAIAYEFCGSALTVYAFNFSDGNYLTRALTYLIGWFFAVTVSGAHFNPATTLGVFIYEKNFKEHAKFLILYMFAQFTGSLAGALITFSIFEGKTLPSLYNLIEATLPPFIYPST